MFIFGKKKKKADKDKKSRNILYQRLFRRVICTPLAIAILFTSTLVVNPKPANAWFFCMPCSLCQIWDVIVTIIVLKILNIAWESIVKDDISYIMNLEYEFINDEFFEEFWATAVAETTEYLTAYGMYQVEIVGSFMDAKNQLETTRLIFKLQAEAHKDYQVSEDFCWFGTNARSLAASESRAHLNMRALSKLAIDRQLGKQNVASAQTDSGDKTSRWHQFVDTFCDKKDNGWASAGTGLDRACDHDGDGSGTILGADDRTRVNSDLDYTRLVEIPRTIDINFSDGVYFTVPPSTPPSPPTDDEKSILSMSSNLYGNIVPSRRIDYDKIKNYPSAQSLYLDQRTIIARRSVAQNSFNAIVSMKSAGTSSAVPASGEPQTASYMAAILKEIMPSATTNDEVLEIIGENPSYYAQLEMLAKKIYENPKFFAKLYDTPANVARKSVAMKAIELMLDRALLESELRQEMLLSVMLSSDLDQSFRRVNKSMTGETD